MRPRSGRGQAALAGGRIILYFARYSPAKLRLKDQFHLRFKFRFTHFQRMSLIRPASFSRR
jgi:hypothetical protein